MSHQSSIDHIFIPPRYTNYICTENTIDKCSIKKLPKIQFKNYKIKEDDRRMHYDNLTKEDKQLLIIESRKALARKSFYYYCRLQMPTVYTDEKKYLKDYCDVLQAAFEGRLWKEKKFNAEGKEIPNLEPFKIAKTVEEIPYNMVTICKNLMINMPPQHYKSRTLTLFCTWMLGVDPENTHILSVSYNQDVADTFSKYSRDTISEQKIGDALVYSDVFPNTKLNAKDRSAAFWCVNNSYFSYAAAGMGGSVTSKGPTVRIIDDPIKGSNEALNDAELERQYTWYKGTFKSRKDASVEEPLTVINMTRWKDTDLCGCILASPDAWRWHRVIYKAYDEETDKMLCESVLSRRLYNALQAEAASDVDKMIFEANYNQDTYSINGALYKNLRRYNPVELSTIIPDAIKCKIDTADQGADYLCAIWYYKVKYEAYIIDVLYTQAPQTVTEPQIRQKVKENRTNYCDFEGNKDGGAFMRLVERNLELEHWNRTIFDCPLSKDNKEARIRANASIVIKNIHFPIDAESRWPAFMKDVKKYQASGKNLHDDAPDTLTMVALDIDPSRDCFVCDVDEFV